MSKVRFRSGKRRGRFWCAAPNCSNSRKTGVRLFRFPKDEERCRKWVLNSKRQDLMNKSNTYLYANCFICADHFDATQYMNPFDITERKLLRTAIPTLFDVPSPPSQLKSERKLQPDKETLSLKKMSPEHADVLRCEYCLQTLDNHIYLEAHLVNAHGLTLSQDSLLSRLTRKEETPQLEEEEELSTKDNLDQQDRVVNKESEYLSHVVENHQCHLCGLGFKDKFALVRHFRHHVEQKAHGCETCGKAFARKSRLKRHMLTHSEDKPHKCEICGKGFKCTSDRNRHTKRHAVGLFDNQVIKPKTVKEMIRQRKTSANGYESFIDISKLITAKKIKDRIHQGKTSKNGNESHNDISEDKSDTLYTFENIKDKIFYLAVQPLVSPTNTAEPSFADILYESQQMLSDYKPNLDKPFPCKHCDRAYVYKRDLKRHHLKSHAGIEY